MSERDKYVEKMKDRLDEWNDEIDKLEEGIRKAKGAATAEMKARLADSREMYEVAKKKLETLRTSDAPWESLRDDLEHVWKVLKQSVNYFKSQL